MKRAPWLLAYEEELVEGRDVELDPAEARHARGALRLASGRPVVLTDGAGVVASGILDLLSRGRATVSIESVDRVPQAPPGLTLAVGVLAGAAMDLVVQKAVELGVDGLVPVCCQRSQLGKRRATARMDHWSRLARQALKQCRRPWAMTISPPTRLADLVAEIDADRAVVAHPDGRSFDELTPVAEPLLLVGPEGGFTPEEEQRLGRAQWSRVHLGPHILRAETAAIAGTAVLLNGLAARSGVHSSDG